MQNTKKFLLFFLVIFCHAESKYFVYVADACKGQFGITKNVTCYLSTSFYRLPCSSVGHVKNTRRSLFQAAFEQLVVLQHACNLVTLCSQPCYKHAVNGMDSVCKRLPSYEPQNIFRIGLVGISQAFCKFTRPLRKVRRGGQTKNNINL